MGQTFVVGPFSPGQGRDLIKAGAISGGFMWNPMEAGRVFVTSGLGGRFPPGFPVGTITALRRSQLALMDELDTSHPFYWSAFAAIGDGTIPVIRGADSQASAPPDSRRSKKLFQISLPIG